MHTVLQNNKYGSFQSSVGEKKQRHGGLIMRLTTPVRKADALTTPVGTAISFRKYPKIAASLKPIKLVEFSQPSHSAVIKLAGLDGWLWQGLPPVWLVQVVTVHWCGVPLFKAGPAYST
jgi:hypothetical protein